MKFVRGERRRIKPKLDVIPLLSVVFQLVLFFMLSSTFAVQRSIHIEMPQAEGTLGLEQRDLSVTLACGAGGPGGEGPVYVNDAPVETWGELSRKLTDARNQRKEVLLLIRPDARVPAERLVRVLGIASSVGIEHYGIAARPPESGE